MEAWLDVRVLARGLATLALGIQVLAVVPWTAIETGADVVDVVVPRRRLLVVSANLHSPRSSSLPALSREIYSVLTGHRLTIEDQPCLA